MRTFAVAGVLALLVLRPGSGVASAPDDVPGTQVVRIDLIASDARGRSIDSLKPADFELRDDGDVRALDDVRFLRPSPDEARLVAVFLDEYHVSAGATERVRTSLKRFIQDDLRPRDLLVVMKPLDSVFGVRLTTERDAALAAVQTFEGRRGEYDARNAYEQNFMAGVPSRIEATRTQVALSAINALAIHFSGYPDQRKTLIVVSEGFGRTERRRGMEYLPTFDTIRRSAQQSNVAVYAINPGDAVAKEGDPLAALAVDTAGVATGELDGGLRQASEESGAYYLLTYRAQRPDDGKYHPVDVRVKRAGTQVRARRGYFAPSPDEALRKTLLARIDNPAPAPPPEPAAHASLLIRPWIGTSRGENGKTRVTMVWEPVIRPSTDRLKRTPSRITLTALAADNSVLFEGVLLPTGPGAVNEVAGPPSRATFEMKPGRLRLRMSILDAAQAVLDTDVRSIAVRDMQGVSIGTPEVLRARNAREFRALENALAVPVAAREFSRAERLFIRFEAYGPGGAPVAVTARLLSRGGPMRDLIVADVETPDGQGPSDGKAAATVIRGIDVPLAGLAAGDYVIELSASGPGGAAKDVIDFRVTT